MCDGSSPEVSRRSTVDPAELVKPPVPRGRPGHRLQLGSGRRPSDRSMSESDDNFGIQSVMLSHVVKVIRTVLATRSIDWLSDLHSGISRMFKLQRITVPQANQSAVGTPLLGSSRCRLSESSISVVVHARLAP